MFKHARMSFKPDIPTQPSEEQVSLGSYGSFSAAHAVEEYLADLAFEENDRPQLVGSDLLLRARFMGELTWRRILLLGAGCGAWIGLLVVLLLAILGTPMSWPATLLGAACGGAFGVAFAAFGFALTSGRHRYVLVTPTAPTRFEILVSAADGERCRNLLAALPADN
jgi:hypothetical protein